ncbi:MAG: hypothetical protein ACYTG0_08880 [Planctomycetota bacterium]|jgi:hypothetical protein
MSFEREIGPMTPEAQRVLRSFESLAESAKREVASEIIRRSLKLGLPPLSEEALVVAAEQLFQDLDRDESGNG